MHRKLWHTGSAEEMTLIMLSVYELGGSDRLCLFRDWQDPCRRVGGDCPAHAGPVKVQCAAFILPDQPAESHLGNPFSASQNCWPFAFLE